MTRNREAVMVNKWLPKASSIPDLTLALSEQPDSLRLLALSRPSDPSSPSLLLTHTGRRRACK